MRLSNVERTALLGGRPVSPRVAYMATAAQLSAAQRDNLYRPGREVPRDEALRRYKLVIDAIQLAGTMTRLAGLLDVSVSTVSRWKSLDNVPSDEQAEALEVYIKIKSERGAPQ